MSKDAFRIEYSVDPKRKTLKLTFIQGKNRHEALVNCKTICIEDQAQDFETMDMDNEYGIVGTRFLPECSGNDLVLTISFTSGYKEPNQKYHVDISSRYWIKGEAKFIDYGRFYANNWSPITKEFARVFQEIAQKYPSLGRPLKEFKEEQERRWKKEMERIETYIMSNQNKKPKGKAVLYKKPTGKNASIYCGKKKDVNGKTIWVNWDKWIDAIDIDSPKNLKKLPKELFKFVDKWEQAFLKKKEEKFEMDYPIRNVSIRFIYNDDIYRMTPEAFKNATNDYFWGVHESIEKDLQEAGCIYTFYNDFLD